MMPKFVKPICVTLLLPLLLSLTACATTSPVCVTSTLSYPEMPSLSETLPQQPYSLTAQQNIKGWRQKLNAMPATSAP